MASALLHRPAGGSDRRRGPHACSENAVEARLPDSDADGSPARTRTTFKPSLAPTAAVSRAWLLCGAPLVTNVVAPWANAVPASHSSLRTLLPPPPSPVRSSRLIHKSSSPRPSATPSRGAGSQRCGPASQLDPIPALTVVTLGHPDNALRGSLSLAILIVRPNRFQRSPRDLAGPVTAAPTLKIAAQPPTSTSIRCVPVESVTLLRSDSVWTQQTLLIFTTCHCSTGLRSKLGSTKASLRCRTQAVPTATPLVDHDQLGRQPARHRIGALWVDGSVLVRDRRAYA